MAVRSLRLRASGTAGFRFTLTGQEELINSLRAAGERGVRAASAGLYLVANDIMTQAKKLSPVDTGAMRGSGYVTLPQGSRMDEVVVEVGFGGPSKKYVMIQHEDLTLRHPVGEAKFLETPLFRASRSSTRFLRYTREVFDRDGGPTSGPGSAPQEPNQHAETMAAKKAARKASAAARREAKKNTPPETD